MDRSAGYSTGVTSDHGLAAVPGRVGHLALGRGVQHDLGAAHDAPVAVVDVFELDARSGRAAARAFEKLRDRLRAPIR